ncbi:DUF937 domain-containing protein [Pseudaminobacter arsenicus]|uniref:DUF937 domain-containing protein n=1 Tax=Borborobacter arsenicus TaxID=1851146 RepID=A0A432VA83_9HYPH|nr:DUF937 domain-containing protein [Pseudaminobacter arsenicus]RUM99101.1 DUF937 domain-containing protein [Pseudaminobacter arsenicus]
MLPLFDMLANAQQGNGMEALARQFGLSQQQAQAAVEALLPAFSQGLKQNTADPYGIGAFMTAMASGQHAKYFDNPANAFSPSGIKEGNGILGHLFGSKDLSRAVADQAAQATGIGQEVLKQMLPVIASMIMGGLAKQSNSQLQAGGFGSGSNPLGEIIEQMMRQGGGMGTGGGQPQSPNPMDNPLGRILEGMFGGEAQPAPQPRGRTQEQAQSPYGDNPLGKIFEEMLGGGQGQRQPEPQADTGPAGRPQNPYDDLFGKMFETGAKQRDDYQKSVESIFEQFTRGMDRHR